MLYLSDEWLIAADRAVATLTPCSTPVSVGYQVTGGPEGERHYTIELGGDRVQLVNGATDADVTLSLHWDLATKIATGAASAQRCFLDGEIRLSGDIGVLLRHAGDFQRFEDKFRDLRSSTNFSS